MRPKNRGLKNVLRSDFIWFSGIQVLICGVLLVCFYYFNVTGRFNEETAWLESYSQSFIKDIQLGDVASVQAKIRRFASRHHHDRVEVIFGNNKITALGAEPTTESRSAFLLSNVYSKLSGAPILAVAIKDPAGTTFGTMTIVYHPVEFYRTAIASIFVIIFTLVALLLVIIGLYIRRVNELEKPFSKLMSALNVMKFAAGGAVESIEQRLKKSIIQTGIIDLDFVQEEFANSLAATVRLQHELNQVKVTAAIARTTQSLAHDVRKPFSMLKMVLESIFYTEDPNESREIAKAALPEVNQAMASVEGMIQDVMQIGSNSKPNQEVASCEAMIDAAVNELFRIFPEADVGIEYDLNHSHCLFIDTMRVGRVFSNILVNAVQAMNSKGNIWIKTHEEKGFVEFRLGNAGSCIPKDSLGCRNRPPYADTAGSGSGPVFLLTSSRRRVWTRRFV